MTNVVQKKYAKLPRVVYPDVCELFKANSDLVKTMTSPQLVDWANAAFPKILERYPQLAGFTLTVGHVDGVRSDLGLQRTVRAKVKRVSEIAQMKKDILTLAHAVLYVCPDTRQEPDGVRDIINRSAT
jgi:hypothetical protein